MCALMEIVQTVWADLYNTANVRFDNIDDSSAVAVVVLWSSFWELIGLCNI